MAISYFNLDIKDKKSVYIFMTFKALFLLIMFLVCSLNAQENKSDLLEENYSTAFSEYAYFNNSYSSIHQIGMTVGYIYPAYSLEYRAALMQVSVVRRKSKTYRYSFQIPVAMVLHYLGKGIDKLIQPNKIKDYDTTPSTISYITSIPNSSIQYNFGKSMGIGFSTTTNYLLLKDNGLDRGILFSPAVGMTYIIDEKRNRSGVTFSISYSHFLNFDGVNESDGLGFKINLYWITTS